jgi:hypothetical protein
MFEAVHGGIKDLITGITPAISQNVVDLSLAAIHAAKANGVAISCDYNLAIMKMRRSSYLCEDRLFFVTYQVGIYIACVSLGIIFQITSLDESDFVTRTDYWPVN